MNEKALLQEIELDLYNAKTVVYLEGRSDVPIFFALLGITKPEDDRYQGVYIKGLSEKSRGSGGSAVRQRLEIASKHKYAGVLGIVDGDGLPLSDLRNKFDEPYAGPIFNWKAYCIENLLAKTGWPSVWGDAPSWTDVLIQFAPYVALNRVHIRLRDALKTLRLSSFQHPHPEKDFETVESIAAALREDKHLIEDLDVEHRFLEEAASFQATVRSSLDEGHALLNGKWLLDVFAPRISGIRNPENRIETWLAHAIAAGGLPEVRALWQRITRRA